MVLAALSLGAQHEAERACTGCSYYIIVSVGLNTPLRLSWHLMASIPFVTSKHHHNITGPSCSKLTTLLVNDSLKFTSSDTQISEIFC